MITIDPALWSRLHGASVHFPIALTLASLLFEGLEFLSPRMSSLKTQLHAAARFTIILGALGTIPAVCSGMLMTRGNPWGHDALLLHHLFVWPAFAGLVGLGTWRGLVGDPASRTGLAIYLTVLFLVTGLMAGAGYWGGELVLNS